MRRVVFILGGANSGKTKFALERANLFSGKKFYLATGVPTDSEMEEKIRKHKKERQADWVTIEEPIYVVDVIKKKELGVLLIDSLGTWITNLIVENIDTKTQIESFLEAISSLSYPTIIVSEEVGLGVVPKDPLTRDFVNILGDLNRKVAKISDEVYFLISGVPMRLK